MPRVFIVFHNRLNFERQDMEEKRLKNGSFSWGGIWWSIEGRETGSWLQGFSARLDCADVLLAELSALRFGLPLAWNLGFRNVH